MTNILFVFFRITEPRQLLVNRTAASLRLRLDISVRYNIILNDYITMYVIIVYSHSQKQK